MSGLNKTAPTRQVLGDPKNNLVNVYVEAVEMLQPMYVLLEQVTYRGFADSTSYCLNSSTDTAKPTNVSVTLINCCKADIEWTAYHIAVGVARVWTAKGTSCGTCCWKAQLGSNMQKQLKLTISIMHQCESMQVC